MSDLEDYFTGEKQNIGVLQGEPWNLCDVDLDSPEAMWAWMEFAVETGVVFGHRSKPASHYFFRSDRPLKSQRYKDPVKKDDKAEKEDKACLMELRSLKTDGTVGLQTVVPPSIHPSGELIEFVPGLTGEPATVDAQMLKRATDHTAACALLGRYAPAPGARHDFFLAIAGALAHAKWDLGDASKVVRAIYRILWGHQADLAKADKEVDSTFQRHDDGHEITGLPYLETVLDAQVFRKAIEWLGLGSKKAKAEARATVTLRSRTPGELYDLAIPKPELLIEDCIPRRGATLFTGVQKIGKTVLSTQFAIAVARGKPLFDNYRVLEKGPVMVIEQDDPNGAASIREILQAAGVARNEPIHFVEKDCQLVLGEEFILALEGRIKTEGLLLVVLDSYTALRAPRHSGGDIVKADQAEITLLDELGKRANCALVLLHHDSNAGRLTRDWASRAAGTFGITMACESQIHIARYGELAIGAPERHLRILGRHFNTIEMTLRFNETQLAYDHILEGEAASVYPQILEIHTAFGSQEFTVQEYGQRVGISRMTAHRMALKLVRIGILQSTGWHTFHLGRNY
jgi:hypothetical protein